MVVIESCGLVVVVDGIGFGSFGCRHWFVEDVAAGHDCLEKALLGCRLGSFCFLLVLEVAASAVVLVIGRLVGLFGSDLGYGIAWAWISSFPESLSMSRISYLFLFLPTFLLKKIEICLHSEIVFLLVWGSVQYTYAEMV